MIAGAVAISPVRTILQLVQIAYACVIEPLTYNGRKTISLCGGKSWLVIINFNKKARTMFWMLYWSPRKRRRKCGAGHHNRRSKRSCQPYWNTATYRTN